MATLEERVGNMESQFKHMGTQLQQVLEAINNLTTEIAQLNGQLQATQNHPPATVASGKALIAVNTKTNNSNATTITQTILIENVSQDKNTALKITHVEQIPSLVKISQERKMKLP
mmetsp:Transcript_10352/g.14292  ORF Transcript_10352/g.14292 Transcript_10352/m.14292 type:complete len:116 (-) Transcript_10352:96-443(-)